MATLSRRLQVLLDEGRFRRLEDLAARRGASIATLVREALDRTYGVAETSPQEAADSFLDRPAADIGDWDRARRQIESGYERAGT